MTDTRLVVVANGPQGPPGIIGLSQLADWSGAVSYPLGRAVVWQDKIYVALTRTINEQPDTHPQVWSLLDLETQEGSQGKVNVAVATLVNELVGGPAATDALLKTWTAAGSYEMLDVTYDLEFVNTVGSATILWPLDGSDGVFTTLHIDAASEVIDEYEVTHALSGKTVHQPRLTLNGDGQATVIPPLAVV